MPTLRKEILPEDKYSPIVNGKQEDKAYSRKDLSSIAKTANTMVRQGLRIPAPFGHNKLATPEPSSDSFNNAGYWNRFWVSTESGKPALWGEIDVPGDDDQPESPYYKAKNTAKEVSVCIRPEYIDGKKRKWKNALMHVALVNHPVVPGQTEFQDVTPGDTIVNMSVVSERPNSNCESKLPALIKKLREVCKISVPDSSTVESFIHDLEVAVGQYALSTPDKASDFQPAPVYLSTISEKETIMLQQAQIDALIAGKVVNPMTQKPYIADDFKTEPVKPEPTGEIDPNTLAVVRALAKTTADTVKASIKTRLDSLVAKLPHLKAHADANWYNKLDYQLSAVPGSDKVNPHPLEDTLTAMESLALATVPPGKQDSVFFSTAPVNQANPLLQTAGDVTPEVHQKALQDLLKLI